MNIFSLLSFGAFIVYIYLGLMVFNADKKAWLNRLFMLLCTSFAVWALAYTFIYVEKDPAVVNFWDKASAFGWCIYASFILHLALILTGKTSFLKKWWAYMLIYFPAVASLAIVFTVFSSRRSPTIAEYSYFRLGNLIYILGYNITALYLIWKWGKHSTLVRQKKQAQIIVPTGTVALVLGCLSNVAIPAVGITGIPLLAHVTMLILVFGIWYAIIKYKLMIPTSLVPIDGILDKVNDLVMLIDLEGNIVKVNKRAIELLGYEESSITGKQFGVILSDNSFDYRSSILNKSLYCENRMRLYYKSRYGEDIPVSICTSLVTDKLGDKVGIVIVGQDTRIIRKLQKEIIERKLTEEQLKFLSWHDALTGLHNRTFFEQEIQRLEREDSPSIGIIVCDVNGLKLINDTLGHHTGDVLLIAAADVIKSSLGKGQTVARIGGDEFSILMPESTAEEVAGAERRIRAAIEKYNEQDPKVPLSMSLGFSTSMKGSRSIMDLFKEADNNMYREKLNHKQSVRSSIVKALEKTLEARDYISEGHAERLQDLVVDLALDLGMSEIEIADMRLLAKFHDIGKVGTPDNILFKKGALTPEEVSEMRQHCEIGYRIAQASPDLSPISDWILKHHEWWNGAGYPFGVKGEEIPIQCRILAIADAYDAMTNDRPYRKAMSNGEAIFELKRCAGLQFDPALVSRFITLLERRISEYCLSRD